MQMLKFQNVLFLSLLSFGVAACGAKKDDSSDTEDTDAPVGTVSGTGGGGSSPATFSIVGSWHRDNSCTPAASLKLDGGGDEGQEGSDDDFSRESFTFGADGSLNVAMRMFSDAGCVTKQMDIDIVGTYALGDEVSADPLTKQLDFAVTGGSLTIYSADVVAQLNSSGTSLALDDGNGEDEGFCSKATPWVVGVAADFKDITCVEDIPAIGQKVYEVVSVVGDMLHLGDGDGETTDGSTPEKRPTAANKDVKFAYVKQAAAE